MENETDKTTIQEQPQWVRSTELLDFLASMKTQQEANNDYLSSAKLNDWTLGQARSEGAAVALDAHIKKLTEIISKSNARLSLPHLIVGRVVEIGDIEALGNKPGIVIETSTEQLYAPGRSFAFCEVEIRLKDNTNGKDHV